MRAAKPFFNLPHFLDYQRFTLLVTVQVVNLHVLIGSHSAPETEEVEFPFVNQSANTHLQKARPSSSMQQ